MIAYEPEDPKTKDRYLRELRRDMMLSKGEFMGDEQEALEGESSDDSEEQPVLKAAPLLQMAIGRSSGGRSAPSKGIKIDERLGPSAGTLRSK
ncbi:hypothetical protein AMTR_s00026p00217570 [Amborella trichopoda]|uniref:Uncharacterized protein n=1 Tax=Amborella trichopoda TaxID=13333 RepID=W1PQV2_AMBTC|nr:hypothetical protein AMTR_s00026p00217570 [Amborella trichopoda]